MNEVTEQGTGAWLNARVGNLTGSNMWRAMSFLKNGKESSDRIKYKKELIAERLTGDAVPHYVNDFMRWGNEQEPFAKKAYQIVTGNVLQSCRYTRHPIIDHFGGSPDALILPKTVVEFKCPQSTTHIDWLEAGVVPEQHKPQILSYLACLQMEHAVFVSFDPRLPRAQQLFIVDWTPTYEEIEAVELAAVQFLKEVDDMFMRIVNAPTHVHIAPAQTDVIDGEFVESAEPLALPNQETT